MKKIIFSQYGRSMVEMLGVLAIIGVLSVGAIAGYSKAMLKYKLNKQIEQYNQLFGTIISHYQEFVKLSTQTTYQTLYPIIAKMGELPDGMTTSEHLAYDIFKHKSEIRSFHRTGVSLYISLSILDKNKQHIASPDARETCRNFYQYSFIPWQNDIKYVFFYYNDTLGEEIDEIIYGNKECSQNAKCLKDLTINDIYAICNNFDDNRKTRIVVRFLN